MAQEVSVNSEGQTVTILLVAYGTRNLYFRTLHVALKFKTFVF